MADKTMNTLKVIGALVGIVVVIATPITAITLATYTGNAAQKQAERATGIAEDAKKLGEQNARDFAFFKGQVMTNLEGLNKSVEKIDSKQDRVIEIMSGFMRADDAK